MNLTSRNPKRRSRILGFIAVPIIVLAATAGLASCSNSDSKSADSAATDAPAAPATETTETKRRETSAKEASEIPATEIPAAEIAAPATTESPALTDAKVTDEVTDTAAVGSTDSAVTAALAAQMIPGMLKNFNGGQEPDPSDVACVTGKVKTEDLGKLMEGASGGTMPKEFASILKAMIECKPKGLSESFSDSLTDPMPSTVTSEQKKCLGDKVLDAIGRNDELLQGLLSDAATPPPAFKELGRAAVKACIPAGAAQDELLKAIDK